MVRSIMFREHIPLVASFSQTHCCFQCRGEGAGEDLVVGGRLRVVALLHKAVCAKRLLMWDRADNTWYDSSAQPVLTHFTHANSIC